MGENEQNRRPATRTVDLRSSAINLRHLQVGVAYVVDLRPYLRPIVRAICFENNHRGRKLSVRTTARLRPFVNRAPCAQLRCGCCTRTDQ